MQTKLSEEADHIKIRLLELEEYRLVNETTHKARSGLLATIVKYGPIVATILLALLGVGITLKEMQP